MQIRVAIYNRCSTEEEAQRSALLVQVEESVELAKKLGWIVSAQYIESESGTSSKKRKEYQRLLADMHTDLFDVIMIKSIDRLMRSARDWYLFLDQMNQCKKRLYLYIEGRFYEPEDSLITGIKAIMAEDFSRELSKKIKNSHRRRQEKKSGLNISVPMFGWDKIEKDRYRINEAEAKAYREAFAMAEAGDSFYHIANVMYEKGVHSKNGKRISDSAWRGMLYAPRAHGTVILHQYEYDFERKCRVRLDEREWIYIDNALPAIVTKEYQESVIAIIQKRCRTKNG